MQLQASSKFSPTTFLHKLWSKLPAEGPVLDVWTHVQLHKDPAIIYKQIALTTQHATIWPTHMSSHMLFVQDPKFSQEWQKVLADLKLNAEQTKAACAAHDLPLLLRAGIPPAQPFSKRPVHALQTLFSIN